MDLLLRKKSDWLWLLLGLLYCSDFCVAAELNLTWPTQPAEGEFSEGPHNFTCTVVGFDGPVIFKIGGMQKYVCGRRERYANCGPSGSNDGSNISGTNSSNDSFTVVVRNISEFNGMPAQCTYTPCSDSMCEITSNTIHICVVKPLSDEATLPSVNGCNLTGYGNISVNWNSTFNAQYRVEGYDVTVAPASCSSNQVSPNEDFSCPVLTHFTITVTPKNCGGQRGGSLTVPLIIHPPNLVPNPPSNVTLNWTKDQVSIKWMESLEKARNVGHCSARVRAMSYILFLESDAGRVIEMNIMAAVGNCSSGSCWYTFPSNGNQFRNVTIAARNEFGISAWIHSEANFVQGNIILLVASYIFYFFLHFFATLAM